MLIERIVRKIDRIIHRSKLSDQEKLAKLGLWIGEGWNMHIVNRDGKAYISEQEYKKLIKNSSCPHHPLNPSIPLIPVTIDEWKLLANIRET